MIIKQPGTCICRVHVGNNKQMQLLGNLEIYFFQ